MAEHWTAADVFTEDAASHGDSQIPEGRAALLIAHPGHELTVHGWLERQHPEVFVLTDGSGRSGVSRLHSTGKVLRAAGAVPGEIYGRFPEAAIYRALLEGDLDLFVSLGEELATALEDGEFGYVAADMAEGFNPVHDVWRMVVNAAVALVRRRAGRQLLNFEFSLFRRQDANDVPGQKGRRIELDAAEFMRKLKTAQAYPELAPEVVAAIFGKMDDPILGDPAIKDQVEKVLGSFGLEAFRVEYLRQLGDHTVPAPSLDPAVPFYELYGEKLVAVGRYAEVLRYRDHIAPVAAALQQLVETPAPAAV